MPDGTNKTRNGWKDTSHIWDANNTPWNPDDDLPWEDNLIGFPEGVNKTRNS